MVVAESVGYDLFGKVGFDPSPEQGEILDSDYRFNLVAGGEQGGKSMLASKFLLSHVFDTESGEPGLYWLVGSDYAQTEREFVYLSEDFEELGVLKSSTKRVDPGQIVLHDGTRIVTKSAKDPRKLAREAPDGIIGCEASQLDILTFERMRGRTAPKKGWLFMAGTFEGSLGWYPATWSQWQSGHDDRKSWSLPTWTNLALYPEGREDPEILKLENESSDEYFMERIAGVPVPPRGLVFNEIRADMHVRDIEYIRDEPVHLWVDPGYAGAYAVEAVQIVNDRPQVFDEVYEQGLITTDIISVVQSRPWSRDVQFGVIDVAGYQHQAQAAPAETWLSNPSDGGMGLYMASNRVRIPEGIERLKSFLKVNPLSGEPGIIFSPKCKGLLSELGVAPNPHDGQTKAYSWRTDREGNIVGNTPEDRYNHAVKALSYGLVQHFGYVSRSATKIRVKHW